MSAAQKSFPQPGLVADFENPADGVPHFVELGVAAHVSVAVRGVCGVGKLPESISEGWFSTLSSARVACVVASTFSFTAAS